MPADRAAALPLPLEERWNLFLRHRQMLADYIRCLVRNAPEAEDIFQEVGVLVMRHERGPDQRDRFAAWCRGIARNLARERWRAQRREFPAMAEEMFDIIDQAYEEADTEAELWGRRRWALGVCLESLGKTERELLRRRYADGVGADALGKRLGLSPEAVRMKIMRLRQALSRCIEKRLAAAGEA